MPLLRSLCLSVLAGTVLCCAGCGQFALTDPAEKYIRPTVAVMKFENRAAFPLGWQLSDGMADVLVDRLVATGRFHVIERAEADALLRELRFQHSGATRKERRAALGRIKNVKYVIKGTITDFGHVSTSDAGLGLGGLDLFGSGQRAVMGMTLQVVEVETFEVIASVNIQKTVSASNSSVRAVYKDVAFGGRVFYRKPLGRATAEAIDEAVREISRVIAARPWTPRVALVQGEKKILLNGGQNRRVCAGQVFEVYALGDPIIDPETGDTLGRSEGRVLGRIRIVDVRPRYSIAEVVQGKAAAFTVGQTCRPIRE